MTPIDSLNLTVLQMNLTGDNANFAEDVKVIDGIAYVADGSSGIKTYDLRDFRDPLLLDSINPIGITYNTCVTGVVIGDESNSLKTYTRLYLGSGGDGLYEIDASDPTDLLEINTYGNSTTPEDFAFIRDIYFCSSSSTIEADYLYLATDAGLIYYRCSMVIEQGENSLESRKYFDKIKHLRGVYATSDYAFCAGGDGYLTIIDVTDKNNPQMMSNIQMPNAQVLWDVYVKDDVAYLMDQGSHFYIVDVSDKANPELLNAYTFAAEPIKSGSEGRIVVIGDYAIMGNQYPSDGKVLRVLDISNPTQIEEAGFYQLGDGNGVIGIDVINNVVYSANTKSGLQIFEFNPDGYKFDMTATKSVDYEVEDEITANIHRYYSGVPFTYANVHLEDYYGNVIADPKPVDEFGNVTFNITKTDTLPTRVVAVNTSETIQTEKRDIFADYKEFASVTVNKNELPAIKDENVLVTAYEYAIYPPDEELNTAKVPSVGATVTTTFTDKDGNVLEGLTGTDGELDINGIYQRGTTDVRVTVDKVGFLAYTLTVKPYMWSRSNKALGSTSANHIIRNSIDKRLYMTYYMYDMTEPPIGLRQHKIILGTSSDEGKSWELEKVANGFNPSIVQLSDGDVGLLYDEGISYLFENAALPDPSTVTNGSLKVEPGSVALNLQTGLLHSTGIKTLYTEDNLNLIHAVFDANNPEDAQVEIAINKDGLPDQSGATRVPYLTPSISMWYNSQNTTYYPMIAFVDTDYDVILRYFDKEYNSFLIENISNSPTSLSLNPYIECKGENTFLVWQEQVNTDEYAIYMNGSRSFVDSTFTDKRFPKVKNGTYISCLEKTDLNRIKVFPYQTNYYKNPITMMETRDSVFSPDISYKTVYDTKNQKTTHTVYGLWEQKTGSIYKIKTDTVMFITDKNALPTSFAGFTDTSETTESPIYDYVNAKGRRVESFVKDISGLDEGRYYEVELNTTNSSKKEPYVVMIDGEVRDVIYGKENKTLIQLEADDYTDGAVEIRFDRLKGNPNRVIEMGVYEFDEVGDVAETASKASIVLLTEKPKSIEQMKITSSTSGEVRLILGDESMKINNIKIIDVLGREIGYYSSNELKGKKEIKIDSRLKNG
ncbi:MAG: LVIVD repeat-containing protein, partial [bacterium]